jgi:dienelactone hydrolase
MHNEGAAAQDATVVSQTPALEGYRVESFTHDGITHDVYRRGDGPCVLVVAEIPGITPEVIRFAGELLDVGLSVAMPSMFGVPGKEPTTGHIIKTIARACVSREFHALATRDDQPATEWLRALARKLHTDHGGPERAADGCSVLGLRFTSDPSVPGERFATLRRVLGDDFVGVEIESPDPAHGIGKRAHSVLTEERSATPGHPTKEAFDQVIDFLTGRLQTA